ncbi:UDP-glucoronosyl and UDP-glucosyl transferase, partial [Cooperia oncophora]
WGYARITCGHDSSFLFRYSSPYHDPKDWLTLTFKREQVFNVVLGLSVMDFAKMQLFAYNVCRGKCCLAEFPSSNFHTCILEDSSLNSTARFDLGIFEMMHSCPAGVMELAGIPKQCLSQLSAWDTITTVYLEWRNDPSFVPVYTLQAGCLPIFVNTLNRACSMAYFQISSSAQSDPAYQNVIMPEYLNIDPDKTDYFLMNCNEFTESTRPTLLSIHHVGGSAISTPRPLSNEFEHVVSKGAKGVILFSLGSLVKSSDMPVAVRRAFTEAFQSFPEYVIIWKVDRVSNVTYSNIVYYDWVPQVDLLADGRVKLLITHAGMNSIQEAVLFGVPMVTVPLFADQYTNAAVANERGFSVTLDKLFLSKEVIVEAISTVLGSNGESSYTKRVRQAARLLRGSPEEMRRKIKRLARVSGSEPPLNHLKLDIGHLNNFQYYNIDVYLFLCLTFSFSIIMFYYFTAWVVHSILCSRKEKFE